MSSASTKPSSENVKKRLSENGYHSYLGIIPKYKVRKVSAVRDFPPGCGRISPIVDLNLEKNAVVSSNEDMANIVLADSVNDSKIDIESQSVEVMDCPVNLEEDDKLDRLVGEVVAANMTAIENGGKEQVIGDKSLGSVLPKDLENREMDLPKGTKDIKGDNLVKRVDEERSLHLVENVGDEHKTSVKEIGSETDGPSRVCEVKILSPPQQLTSVVESTSFTANNKYRKRRVSAVRDFPPFCGPNAPKTTEQSRFGVIEESKDVAGSDKIVIKNKVIETLRDVTDTETLQERLTENEDASSMRARDISSPEDTVLEQTTVVHNVEQEGGQDDYDERGQAERTVVLPEIMTKKENQIAGIVGKEIVVYSQDERENTTVAGSALGSGDEIVQPITQGAEPYDYDYDERSQEERVVDLPETMTEKENQYAGVAGKEIVLYSPDESEKTTMGSSALVLGNEFVRPISQVAPRKQGKDKSLDDTVGGNENFVSQVKRSRTKTAANAFGSGNEIVKPIVQGLMAEPDCPWRHGQQTSLECPMSGDQVEKPSVSWRKRAKAVARKSTPKPEFPRGSIGKRNSAFVGEAADEEGSGLQAASNDGACGLNRQALDEDSPIRQGQCEFGVTLPPFGPNSSSHGDARTKVRETLRLFQAICRKILQGEESKSTPEEVKPRQAHRIDLQAAKIIKAKGKEVNTGKHILGEVPGVEVGDEFQYRVELAIVGVHRLYQAGIDYMKHGGMLIAISIVSSGVYDDAVEDGDVLIYSGQGGNVVGKDKTPADQKLERGNLALKNSISVQNPVRVIRGSKETKTSESVEGKVKVVTTYVYDGLYHVENYWTEQGPKGKLVFMFKLVRIPGQPELAWKEVKSSKVSKVRHGVCVHDITEGKETLPIGAVNIIDGEKPPPFNYIKKILYPDWFHPSPPKGCDCNGKCSDSKKCSCAVKNGGEIPYNRNGAIVEVKPLVYECGPSCKCPPSCYNRVSQHGIKVPLEIFKTNSRGWGVRALTSIPSGTFICEYAGELLEDKEAERRIGSDEYLFDIGQNYSDCAVVSSAQAELSEVAEEGGYTIDAASYGNVGRFINHSCSPNLYAQNVIYDHEDKKMPHIMLFAADNIPPLTELSYHYNYSVDQVHDSNGNIKVKKCFCGSSECTGRMY